jgi:lysophospholipase L1-like esterase
VFVLSVLLLVLFWAYSPPVSFASDTALPYRVVILGSSTAAGEAARPLDSSWANKYRLYLSAALPLSEVVNLATGGITTFNVMPTGYVPPSPWNTAGYQPAQANNITRALALSPSLIIINLPTNDCAVYIPTATQIANYDRIIQEAQTAGVPVYITTSQPRNMDLAARTLLIQMKDLILSRYGSRAIDFWTGLADPGGYILPAYNFDGTHLNTAAHAILFERVRSTVPPGSSPLPSGPGVLANQGFESGTGNWVFYTNASGVFRAVAPGNGSPMAGIVEIGGTGTNVQLYQTGFPLEAGQQYRLTFQAYSNSGRDFSVTIQQHSPPSTGLGLTDRGFDITPSWQTHSAVFTASGFTGTATDTRIRFWFAPYAQAGDRYYLDNIVLEKVTAGSSAPVITSQPFSQTVAAGQTATFSLSASGTAPLSYQWQKNSVNIPGATGASYTTPAATSGDNGSTYRCIVSNSLGSATSNAATLTVTTTPPPPSGQGVLANQGFESGTGNWVFYSNASGVFRAVAPGNESPMAGIVEIGGTGTNVQLYQTGFPLEAGQQYRLTFQAYSNSGRDFSITIQQHSPPFTLFGLAERAFDITPAWQTYSTTFTASGFSGTVTDTRIRFWFASYAQAGDRYSLDNIVLEKVTAGSSAPTITAQPLSQSVAVGQTVTFSISASGTAPLSYQWQKNSVNISGATGASYTTPAATSGDNGSTYRCIVTNSLGSATSNAGTLTVTATPPPPSSLDLPRNPGFELGTSNWVFYTNGSGVFNAVPGGTRGAFAARVGIAAEGTNVQLYQSDLPLQPNTSYTLTFDAYSTSGHDLAVAVQQHGTPYTNYGLFRDVDLGSSWKNYSLTFTSSGFASPVNDARLMFWLAPQDAAGDVFFFDSIVLVATIGQSAASSICSDMADNGEGGIPRKFGMTANYPNPFNPTTTIAYALPEPATVSLKIYSMLGQEVASLVKDAQPAGEFRVVWDGRTSGGLSPGSGVYIYRLCATGISGRCFVDSRRMILVR